MTDDQPSELPQPYDLTGITSLQSFAVLLSPPATLRLGNCGITIDMQTGNLTIREGLALGTGHHGSSGMR